jgi:hypothetical protein
MQGEHSMFLELLDFLNKNNGAFSVLFSAVVAFATVIYAILTGKLVSETRRMREVQTEPKISVYLLRSQKDSVDIIVENIGEGMAENIKFSFKGDIEYIQGRLLSEVYFIKKGIKHLVPKRYIQFYLCTYDDFKSKKTSFDITASYRDVLGKEYVNTYPLDYSGLTGTIRASHYDI